MVEDFLSRLDTESETNPINYSFPHENLLVVSTNTPWFQNIANYLATGKLPHLSSNEKRRIIKQSTAYSWIGGDLFRIGPNLIIQRCVREDDILDIL